MLIKSAILWLMLCCRACQSTTPYSASETITENGNDCIQLFSASDDVLTCLLAVSDTISTYTLKSRFLDAYGQHFDADLPQAKTTKKLSSLYRRWASENPQQEAEKLGKEIERLGQNKEYVRLLNLLMKFKNTELSTLNALMNHAMNKLETYAKKQLSCASYAHELIEAYTILTQLYSLSNKREEKQAITAEAIALLIEHDATERYPLQFLYFQQQHQLVHENTEKSESNVNSG